MTDHAIASPKTGLDISVVMATYNGERYLEAQMRSLFDQTHKPAELIVSDDGSSDETLALVERLALESPFPVHVRINEQRLGYADNFLMACADVRGDLIALCDQDDVWLPGKLAKVLADFQAHPTAGLVVHKALVVDEELASTGAYQPAIGYDAFGPTGALKLLDRLPGFAMVVRRELVQQFDWRSRPLDLDDPLKQASHDVWLSALANAIGGIFYDAEVLAYYRRHGNNESFFRQGRALQRRLGDMKRNLAPAQLERLRKLQRGMAEHARYFEQAAKAGPADHRDALMRAAERYRRQERIFQARIELAKADWVRRLFSIGRLFLTGGYGSRRQLDRRALAQDLSGLVRTAKT